MMPKVCRQLVLKNNIDRIVYLREAQHAAAEGNYAHETRLDPNSVRRDFPATVYKKRNPDSGRPSRIVVFVGEHEAFESLTPDNFVQYAELIFEMDEANNVLIVRGVPSQGTVDDIKRFGVFGFPRRDYSQRQTVIVRSCGFKVVDLEMQNRGVYSQAR